MKGKNFGQTFIAANFLLNTIKAKPIIYITGVLTVFLSVLVFILLNDSLSKINLLVLQSTESKVGQYDLIISPKSQLLNYNQFNPLLKESSEIQGVFPRWFAKVNANNPKRNDSTKLKITLMIVDFEIENNIGLCSNWPYRALGPSDVLMSSSVFRALQIEPNSGQTVQLSFKSEDLKKLNFFDSNLLMQDEYNYLFTCLDSMDDSYGRYPESVGNIAIVDRRALYQISKSTYNILKREPMEIDEFNSNLNRNAMAVGVLFRNRLQLYNEFDQKKKILSYHWSDEAATAIGTELMKNVTLSTPILEYGTMSEFTMHFINELFFQVIVIVFFLGGIMIFSLLIGDAEEKSFEYGMLRTLGVRKTSLSVLMIFQSFSYSIPGYLLALISSITILIPVSLFLEYASTYLPSFVSGLLTVLLSLIVGIIIPLAATVAPLRDTIKSSLRDALNPASRKISIEVEKLHDSGYSHLNALFASVLVIYGFLTFYLIPFAFIEQNLSLFFRTTSVILLGITSGMLILAQFINYYLNSAILWLLMKPVDSFLFLLAKTNLRMHRARNQKTALMFTTCMAFVVFCGLFPMNTFTSYIQWYYGADIRVEPSRSNTYIASMDELNSFLESKRKEGSILSYSFASVSLEKHVQVQSTQLFPIAPIKKPTVEILAVDRNFFDCVYSQYLIPEAQVTNSDFYQVRQYISAADEFKAPANTRIFSLLTSSNLDKYGVIYPNVLNLKVVTSGANPDKWYLAQSLFGFSKIPGIRQISAASSTGLAIMPMESMQLIYKDLKEFNATNPNNVLISDVFIKLRDNLQIPFRDDILDNISSIINSNDDFKITDTRREVENASKNAQTLSIFADFSALIGFCLSIFVLWTSVRANFNEHSTEFGLLLAVGLEKQLLFRLFVYEILSVLLSCIFLGSIIGAIAAVTLNLQFNLFSTMPLRLTFKWEFYVFCIISTFLIAHLVAKRVTKVCKQKEISAIVRK